MTYTITHIERTQWERQRSTALFSFHITKPENQKNDYVKNLKKNQNGSLKKLFKPNPHHKTQENQTQTGYSHRKKTPKIWKY